MLKEEKDISLSLLSCFLLDLVVGTFAIVHTNTAKSHTFSEFVSLVQIIHLNCVYCIREPRVLTLEQKSVLSK